MKLTGKFEALVINKIHHRGTPVFKHGTSEAQYSLAFPKHVIDYLIANPKSPKQWKKLMQTCKLWFDKNPVLVIQCLHYNNYTAFAEQPKGWKTCSSSVCNDLADQTLNFVGTPIKLWITENLNVQSAALSKTLIPQLYKCHAKKVLLFNDTLSFDELAILTSNVVEIIMTGIKDSNGKVIPFEEIVERLPGTVEHLHFCCHEECWTPETFKKLAKMEHVQKFQKITLDCLNAESFDFDGLFTFILENKQIWFDISFFVFSITNEQKTLMIEKVRKSAEKIRNEDYGIHQRPKILLNGVCIVDSY